MSKKGKKSGGASPLTHLIRILIVVIFLVAVVIAFNRIAEVMQNNEKKDVLQNGQAAVDELQADLI